MRDISFHLVYQNVKDILCAWVICEREKRWFYVFEYAVCCYKKFFSFFFFMKISLLLSITYAHAEDNNNTKMCFSISFTIYLYGE